MKKLDLGFFNSAEMNLWMEKAKKNSLQGYSMVRTINFAAQSALLPAVDQLANGIHSLLQTSSKPKANTRKKSFDEFKNHMKEALPQVEAVLEADVQNIIQGYYPSSVLLHDNLVQHFLRVPKLFIDAFRASKQRINNQSEVFESEDKEFLKDFPDYYKRNFHFQKDGYLSAESAELYEHQVEVLFAGSAQAMRRRLIPPMKIHFSSDDGQGLRILELGCGTGALTRNLAAAFPKAHITAIDLSPHYLDHAKKAHAELKRVDWINGKAENLDFKDQTFDAVVSCYLFHELPEPVRKQILGETYRVLKPNGFIGIADSLQKNDKTDLDWALEQFPIDFHEPFYKNYTLKKLEPMIQDLGFKNVQTDFAFLTKIVSGSKAF